jgi:preprotein translocase subunit SecA
MKYERATMVQRGHNFAIVDEVDSILIDEARTPLIISGPLEDRSRVLQHHRHAFVPHSPTTISISTKSSARRPSPRPATRSSRGCCARPGLLKGENLYDVENVSVVHHVNRR